MFSPAIRTSTTTLFLATVSSIVSVEKSKAVIFWAKVATNFGNAFGLVNNWDGRKRKLDQRVGVVPGGGGAKTELTSSSDRNVTWRRATTLCDPSTQDFVVRQVKRSTRRVRGEK